MPISARPITSRTKDGATTRQSSPAARKRGDSTRLRATCRPARIPAGAAPAMRANPNAPATTPSCQSASPRVRAISGRTGPNAPTRKVLPAMSRHSRAVPLRA